LYPKHTDWTLNSGFRTAYYGSTNLANENVFNLSRDLMLERYSTLKELIDKILQKPPKDYITLHSA